MVRIGRDMGIWKWSGVREAWSQRRRVNGVESMAWSELGVWSQSECGGL